MNVNSGGLSFDFSANNDQLIKIVEQSKREIQGLADASKRGGKDLDAAFKSAFDNLDKNAGKVEVAMSEQRQAIKALTSEMDNLKAKASQDFSKGDLSAYNATMSLVSAKEKEIAKRKEVITACYQALDVLTEEHNRLTSLKQSTEGAANAQMSLKTQLRQITAQLAEMEATQGVGVRQTEEFKRLQQEAGRLKDALSDAQAQVRIFADDNALITGAVSGLAGLAGGFSAVQGAMGLFGVENDKVQQAMLKVQSAIAITNGLQQVANALNKDSAFMLVTVRRAKELLAAAELKLATALGVSTVAARVFMATITLGLSAAITAIIMVVEKFRSASAEADKFNQKVAEAASEPVAKVELLAAKWQALGDDMAAKKKFIDDNKKSFEELGVSIRDVAEAENLLINNKDAFISAQIEKAKAQIYIENNKEKIQELLKAEEDYAAKSEKIEKERAEVIGAMRQSMLDGTSAYTEKAIEQQNQYYDRLIAAEKKKIDEKNAEIKDGYNKAVEHEQEALNIMEDAAIKATQNGATAVDAFTDYILNGTSNAEANMQEFDGKVRTMFNNTVSDLQSSANAFVQQIGNLLSWLGKVADSAKGAAANLGNGTIGDRMDKTKARWQEETKKLQQMRSRDSKATVDEIKAQEKVVNDLASAYQTLSGVSIEPPKTGGGGGRGKGKSKGGGSSRRSGSSRSGGSSAKGKTEIELYAEELNKKKDLYQKYINWATSSDETVREAAKTEFAPLLEGGKTWLAYLEAQRDSISQKATKTALDLQKLAALNNEIAEQTKDAVINDFQKQLDDDLKACTTLGAMLDLIEQRRKENAGDDTEVGKEKNKMLDDAEKATKEQIKSETADLLLSYAQYEAQRLQFAESYARKRQLLEKAIADATTDDQRRAAETALAALEEEDAKWKRAKTGTYAALLDEYKTHQEQLADIQKKFEKERAEAAANGNISMLQMINEKEQEEVSKLLANQLMASDSWARLFSDVSTMSTKTLDRLIKEIEANKIALSAQLNPADLKAIEDQLARARAEIQERNPFLALRDGLSQLKHAMTDKKLLSDKDDPILQQLEEKRKEYETIAANLADPTTAGSVAIDFKATLDGGSDFKDYLRRRIKELQDQKVTLGAEFEGEHELEVLIAMLNKVQGTSTTVGEALKATFGSVAGSIDFVAGCFDSVVNGIKTMGIAMDEETEEILTDIGGILEGASQVAQGLASGNPLAVIQGAISLFASAYALFNTRDRKAEQQIKKHEQALSRLKNAYNELEHAISKALGEEIYKSQTALITNLRAQQAEINGMIAAESSKKKADQDKIADYREQYAELGRQIEDIIDDITNSVTQTGAADLASQLSDALIEAFQGGTDAAKAFGDVANDVIKKAVANALKLQFLEKPLQDAIKQLQRDMGFDEEGNGAFDGLTESEQKRFKDAVEAAGANFQAAMDLYQDLFSALDDSDPTTLSGALRGASQESIDLLAGQTNAVRQNQVTSMALFREQLAHLSSIDANIGVIASRLLTIVNKLTTPGGTDLRSQGITG